MKLLGILITGAVLLGSGISAWADAVIAPNGGTLDWTIVAAAPTEQARSYDINGSTVYDCENEGYECAAANELSFLIGRILGAKPEVVYVNSPSELSGYPRYIAIGRLAAELGAVPPQSRFRKDGSAVVVEKNRILLVGETPIASYFAMTRLAEMAGCRWYMPGELGEYVPRHSGITLKEGTYREVPFVWARNLVMWGFSKPEAQAALNRWLLHNRQGGICLSTGHIWQSIMPTGKYFKEHPEWFSEIGGTRQPFTMCTTNGDAVKEFVRNYRAMMDASPNAISYSISQDDALPFCECGSCQALDSKQRDLIRPFASPHATDRLVNFYNRVVSDVEKDHPGKLYGFLAYMNSLEPPVKEKPLPSLIPQIAPLFYSPYHPINSPRSETMRALGRYIDGWSKLCPNWSYYGYAMNYGDFMLPYSRELEIRQDWPFMAKRGMRFVCMDSAIGWQNLLPYYYLIARLNLDPYADSDKIIDGFYTTFFGPAAPEMREYMGELNSAYDNLEYEIGGLLNAPLVFTSQRLKKLNSLLSSAEKKAGEDEVLKGRIAMWRFAYRCADDYMSLRNEMNRCEFKKASDIADRMWARYERTVKENPYTACGFWWDGTDGLWKVPANEAAKTVGAGRIIHKFPDEWLAFVDYGRSGEIQGANEPGISTGHWIKVKTYSKTLGEQGFIHHYGIPVWYRNSFGLSEADAKQKLHIFFSGVDYGIVGLYINGRKVGGPVSEGWEKPFDFDITGVVKPGENTVSCETVGSYYGEAGGIIRPVVVYVPGGK